MTPERKRGFPIKESLKTAAVVIATAAYFISPVDFLPDFLLPAGIADDGVVMLWAGYLITKIWDLPISQRLESQLRSKLGKKN